MQRSEGDDCWPWVGPTDGNGYGKLRRNGKLRPAHVIAWELAHGPVPKGLEVCHACDNPPCVRDDHLFLGTHKENLQDAARKGRMAGGERNGRSVLTWDKVREIRNRYAAGGISQAALALEYGVAPVTIYNIIHHLRWQKREIGTQS